MNSQSSLSVDVCSNLESQDTRVPDMVMVSSKYMYCHIAAKCSTEERLVLASMMDGDEEIGKPREEFEDVLKPYCSQLIESVGPEMAQRYENTAVYFFNCGEAAGALAGTCLEAK